LGGPRLPHDIMHLVVGGNCAEAVSGRNPAGATADAGPARRLLTNLVSSAAALDATQDGRLTARLSARYRSAQDR
jgi:hypothetical protein